ncbi:hypothetical protein AFCA_000419 [Aspergillus flavus]|uniref:Uncharacterized protein n=1 Tax=Aspergillus flavus TaxID=5059 RepID=A0AB74BZ80_ASPFL|nr:hypothetical protein CA14_007928 [Aspergillus flavus]UCK57499.1 hypothetical protein AFCA_000419 [Aspergillus flavus]
MGLIFPETCTDWKFDLVGLLAIIGESIIEEVVQPLTASPTILLPRLLPAPHALIRPSRRTALPSTPVTVHGVYSGIQLQSIPYFPSMIHQLELTRPYEFQKMTIELCQDDEEVLRPGHDKIATVKKLAPLKLITICSSVWTAGVLAWAIVLRDGPAVVAIVLVSLASSFHSAASFWQSDAIVRPSSTRSPPGDLVLRTREGAFIVVHCKEAVARLLYTGEVKCAYVAGAKLYRILIYVGTLLLMLGIVLMSNCSWTMQVTLGASYLALNVIYMFCALTPAVSRTWHWNMRLVRVLDKSTIITENYTEAIWLAIRATKDIDWVRKGGLIPQTMVWNVWLDEAKLNASNGNANWPATKRKDELLLEDALAKEASNQDDDMSQPKRRPTLL